MSVPILDEAYAAYRAAAAAWRAAAGGPVAERAAERLLHARVDLYRALLAAGWDCPPDLQPQLDRDRALVEAPADFEALLSGVS